MTSFQDGPAKGHTLMLKRGALFLRVVEEAGKWDALDQPDDTPRPTETLHAYQLAKNSGNCHVNFGRGRGGFYPVLEYRLAPNQPSQDVMRNPKHWAEWCEQQPKPTC